MQLHYKFNNNRSDLNTLKITFTLILFFISKKLLKIFTDLWLWRIQKNFCPCLEHIIKLWENVYVVANFLKKFKHCLFWFLKQRRDYVMGKVLSSNVLIEVFQFVCFEVENFDRVKSFHSFVWTWSNFKEVVSLSKQSWVNLLFVLNMFWFPHFGCQILFQVQRKTLVF